MPSQSKKTRARSVIPTEDRVKLVKQKTEQVVDLVRHLLQADATNEIVVYSPYLSRQVGKSYAAHAFNVFQRSLFEHSLVRICSLWDIANDEQARDRISLPAIAWLLNEQSVVNTLVKETYDYWALQPAARVLNPAEDEETRVAVTQAIADHNRKTGKQQAEKAEQWLREACVRIGSIIKSDSFRSIRNFRDKYLAHTLTETRHEKFAPIAMPKFGDERQLLNESVEVVHLLHLGANGSDFAWDEARSHCTRYARALWHGCRIEILE